MTQGDVTRQLAAWGRGGDAEAALFDTLGTQLEKLARSLLKDPGFRRRLEPSELISECYIRLKQYIGTNRDVSFENRARFYSLVLKVMRQVLIDSVRKGGQAKPKTKLMLTIGHADVARGNAPTVDAYDFYLELDRLREKNERQATALELHYVVGWSLAESADLMGISTATLKRQLASARQWFEAQLRRRSSGE